MVAVAAEALASQTANVATVAHAVPIWNRVLIDLGVASLTPAATAVLDTIAQRLAAAVLTPYAGEHRLAAQHHAAVRWIRALGVRRGIADLEQAAEYPIRVHYNPGGDDYCASSSLFANEIGWNPFLERKVLRGSMWDKYSCSKSMSRIKAPYSARSTNWRVQEIWLSAALFWESVELPGDPAEKHVQEALWEFFRRELNKHFDPKNGICVIG